MKHVWLFIACIAATFYDKGGTTLCMFLALEAFFTLDKRAES